MPGITLCGGYLWQVDEKCNDGNLSVDALVALGAEDGCDFTFEDLLETAELSEEELDGSLLAVTSIISLARKSVPEHPLKVNQYACLKQLCFAPSIESDQEKPHRAP